MKLTLASRVVACIAAYNFVSALYTWFATNAVAWFEIVFGALCAAVLFISVRYRCDDTSSSQKMSAPWLAAVFIGAACLTLGLNSIQSGPVEAFHLAGLFQAIVVGLVTVAFCAKQSG